LRCDNFSCWVGLPRPNSQCQEIPVGQSSSHACLRLRANTHGAHTRLLFFLLLLGLAKSSITSSLAAIASMSVINGAMREKIRCCSSLDNPENWCSTSSHTVLNRMTISNPLFQLFELFTVHHAPCALTEVHRLGFCPFSE
jgi:hypothetical protein